MCMISLSVCKFKRNIILSSINGKIYQFNDRKIIILILVTMLFNKYYYYYYYLNTLHSSNGSKALMLLKIILLNVNLFLYSFHTKFTYNKNHLKSIHIFFFTK